MKLHPSLLVVLIFLLVACGNAETPATASPNESPTTETPAPVENIATEASQTAADAAAEAQAEVEAVTESAAEAVDEATQEAAEILAGVVETAEEVVADQPRTWNYSAGKHFSQLTTAQGTASLTGGVEVTEVFWYGCPHCFNFDPYLEKWKAGLPDDVNFVRLPVMWNPTNELHARMFYTAEALGKLEDLHPAFFKAMHAERKTLVEEDEIRAIFSEHDVSSEDFDKTWRSFSVESKLRRAKSLTTRYRVRSVPVLVVNGKYITDGPEVKNFDDMIGVANELIERERQEL